MEAILFDIDGTLSDVKHRRHFVEKEKHDWNSFFSEIPNDKSIKPLVDLARILIKHDEKAILLVTGRPEKTRSITEEWLLKHKLILDFSSRLFMRKDNDWREDHVVKHDILKDIRTSGYEPVLIFDDRQSVINMWSDEGICTAKIVTGNL